MFILLAVLYIHNIINVILAEVYHISFWKSLEGGTFYLEEGERFIVKGVQIHKGGAKKFFRRFAMKFSPFDKVHILHCLELSFAVFIGVSLELKPSFALAVVKDLCAAVAVVLHRKTRYEGEPHEPTVFGCCYVDLMGFVMSE